MPEKWYNSRKSNTSTSVNTGGGNGLEGKISKLNGVAKAKTANGDVNNDNLIKLNQNNPQAPKPGMQRMLFNQLINRYAIPGVSPRTGIPPSSTPAPTPATTSEIELTTQAGDILTTQAGVDLIMQ